MWRGQRSEGWWSEDVEREVIGVVVVGCGEVRGQRDGGRRMWRGQRSEGSEDVERLIVIRKMTCRK